MDAPAPETQRRQPRFDRVDAPLAFQLTDRDIEIVRQVARHRFLRSTHISQLVGGAHKKILERLTLLYRAGYLDRPRAQIEYHTRGGGSAPLVYALGNRGASLLSQHDDGTSQTGDWRHKNEQSGRDHLLHTLAIADVRVALAVACRGGPVKLRDADDLLESLPSATRAARHPWSWRVTIRHKQAVQDVGVLPDHIFALLLPDGRRRAFFLECDRGTMPVERSTLAQTSLLRKFLAYETTRSEGIHSKRFGWLDFRCLVVAPNGERMTNMLSLVARTPAIRSSSVFLFAQQLAHAEPKEDILARQWLDTFGTQHALIPLQA